MKRIREYHIESYWAEEAAKKERRAELKQKLKEGFLIGTLLAFQFIVMFEILRQMFEVI